MKLTLVFVHGWSVTNMSTYGELPLRIKTEIQANGMDVSVQEIFLGRYISFHDEVHLSDISKAFNEAVKEQLSAIVNAGERFICITHSTGGPVLRTWWELFFRNQQKSCPMSHLIMLAPANFGSALAKLGKGKISRLRSWWNDLEPGQGVLDWLELGSDEAWTLGKSWIMSQGKQTETNGFYPFVLTGQWIDRKFYDHLNAYTGELGSDGVVRAASANLNARYIKLTQNTLPTLTPDSLSTFAEPEVAQAPESAFRTVFHRSHVGKEFGIMESVTHNHEDAANLDNMNALMDCIKVSSKEDYDQVVSKFTKETGLVQEQERLEIGSGIFNTERYFIHDRFCMVIFWVHDEDNNPIADFDLLLTAGPDNSPDHLPEGFFVDRQRNSGPNGNITYYLNFDAMKGTDAITNPDGKIIRNAIPGTDSLGLSIFPRPDQGFMHYIPCHLPASEKFFEDCLVPNSTTLVDITLRRLIDKEVFRLEPLKADVMPGIDAGAFNGTRPGHTYVD